MAYFELSKKVLREQYKNIEQIVDIMCYNYKVNPVAGKVLENETNCDFVVSSINAISEIKDKKRIVYILQGETKEELEFLFKEGIKSYIVDNESDLKRLLAFDKKIKLFLRMKFKEHSVYTGKYFVYGFSWQKANELIKELSQNKNVESLNIHFHRRTQNVGEWEILDEFKDALSEESLKKIESVSIGGGVPVRYVNSDPNMESIFDKILEFKNYLNKHKVKLMIELGRYLAGPSVRLVAIVKNVYDNNLILDCSIFNAYMDTYLIHTRLPVLDENKGNHKYLLKGITPDSLDIFRYSVMLPEKKIGDKIIFENAGAYNFHTEFGELSKLETKIVNDFTN